MTYDLETYGCAGCLGTGQHAAFCDRSTTPHSIGNDVVGFEQLEIDPSDTVDVRAISAKLFRPTSLYVPPGYAGALVLEKLMIGDTPCFSGRAPVPLSFFSIPGGRRVGAPTAFPGQPIVMTVRNIGECRYLIVACLEGISS